jgi:hypothetical protein
MAKSKKDLLELAFDKDFVFAMKVVDFLLKRYHPLEEEFFLRGIPDANKELYKRYKLEAELASRVFELSQKIFKLQTLKYSSLAEPSKVDSLAKRFVKIMHAIAKASKGKPSYEWVIPGKAAISTKLANMRADRTLKRIAEGKLKRNPKKVKHRRHKK